MAYRCSGCSLISGHLLPLSLPLLTLSFFCKHVITSHLFELLIFPTVVTGISTLHHMSSLCSMSDPCSWRMVLVAGSFDFLTATMDRRIDPSLRLMIASHAYISAFVWLLVRSSRYLYSDLLLQSSFSSSHHFFSTFRMTHTSHSTVTSQSRWIVRTTVMMNSHQHCETQTTTSHYMYKDAHYVSLHCTHCSQAFHCSIPSIDLQIKTTTSINAIELSRLHSLDYGDTSTTRHRSTSYVGLLWGWHREPRWLSAMSVPVWT